MSKGEFSGLQKVHANPLSPIGLIPLSGGTAALGKGEIIDSFFAHNKMDFNTEQ